MEKGANAAMGQRHAIPPARSTPLATITQEAEDAAHAFLTEHRILRDQLQSEKEAAESLKMQLRDLMRENEQLRERLQTFEARATFLQAYSVEITTCLSNLKTSTSGIIDNALERAREAGVKVVRTPPPETPEEKAEAKEAAELIRRLPNNEM